MTPRPLLAFEHSRLECRCRPIKVVVKHGAMSKRASKKFFYVLQDRKRLPQRFFAALSGRATAHL